MNLIRNRIEKLLTVTQGHTALRQVKHGRPRRGSYQKGVRQFEHNINLQMSGTLKDRLDALCVALNVTRSVLARDALEFYLGIAEAEFGTNNEVITKRKKTDARSVKTVSLGTLAWPSTGRDRDRVVLEAKDDLRRSRSVASEAGR